jgi:hypothetical protein
LEQVSQKELELAYSLERELVCWMEPLSELVCLMGQVLVYWMEVAQVCRYLAALV